MQETKFPQLEKRVLEFWKTVRAFETSVARRKKGPRFVFYEGPPTANGSPGIHHVLTRSFKDMMCRYKTMRGYRVERKGGWDTHGLPVELQVEKKLGLSSKKDIESYGIAAFNKECKESVWAYKQEWERLTERIGYWLDMDNPYITYETSYIETLWRIIQQWRDRGLFYKDYKVVPYCPRCGTPLSFHEVAQGYKTVKDPAIYVKFKLKTNKKIPQTNCYFLAWTTTPWTLPGNVGLAVNAGAEYVVAKVEDEHYVMLRSLADRVLGAHEKARRLKGKDLVGLEYVPLWKFAEPEKGKKVWTVVPADFVSEKDGTGIVHTAVAYGVEDFELGKKEGLAMLHLVNEEGKFTDAVEPWKGMFVKDADPHIIQDLKKRGFLLKEELYEHEYPFCWRCSTPLLYYAKESWFVAVQKVKKQLIANNQRISWYPEHIKNGRFGEWLRDVKDWAFSRERYWGTPLPIWECRACKAVEFVGSVKDLAARAGLKNTYYILRHGHSSRQTTSVVSSWPERVAVELTARGVAEAERAGAALLKKRVDMIVASDLARTKKTAEIVAKKLGIAPAYDKRLREFDTGEYNGKTLPEIAEFWHRDGETPLEHYMRRFELPVPGGESWTDTARRMVDFVKSMEREHEGKTILIVSHEAPLTLLEGMLRGFSKRQIIEQRQAIQLETGAWKKLTGSLLPRNNDMDIDLHRPFVDEVAFRCSSCANGTMARVKEVGDVWFDSGAMPFAQMGIPFAHHGKLVKQILFPADYIVEAIDQTRGWFYTLLAVSTLLGFKEPYKHVISTGHVLDEKGNKMSKSKGNIVNPWSMVETHGADAVRWYFYTINQPGDPKAFREADLSQIVRKFMLTLWNSLVFYKTYLPPAASKRKSEHVLDRWILSRLEAVTREATKRLDAYDITGAARAIESFVIDDLSLWYIRRSRQRFQNPSTPRELEQASFTLRSVLRRVSTIAAPFIPFLAEHIYREIEGGKESVHWQNWPASDRSSLQPRLEKDMGRARDLVALVLAERAKRGVKVARKARGKSAPTPFAPGRAGSPARRADSGRGRRGERENNRAGPVIKRGVCAGFHHDSRPERRGDDARDRKNHSGHEKRRRIRTRGPHSALCCGGGGIARAYAPQRAGIEKNGKYPYAVCGI
ncbi:MAG: class I tRNA ligase family protein [Candidatus Wildermuthbacteria bacterium]|nr:class I tRNA ligase family protein [Candidatus Wildermuthbacteria bacterium]